MKCTVKQKGFSIIKANYYCSSNGNSCTKRDKFYSKLSVSSEDEHTEMTHYKNEAKINQFAQFSKNDHTLAAILNDRIIFIKLKNTINYK